MSDAPEDMSNPDAKADDGRRHGAPPAQGDGAGKLGADSGVPGTSLAPAADAPSGIDPFLAKASETPEPGAPRPLYAKALDYSAHAAMIVGLIGFAWTVSDHVTNRQPAPAGTTATPAKAADASGTATPKAPRAEGNADADGKPDELGELRRANQKMAAEIRGLHAGLEALRTTVVRDRSVVDRNSGDDVRSLSSTVDQVKAGLAAARSEQTTQIALLTGKVDKLQRDARQQLAERARVEAARPEGRLEASRTETRAAERQQIDTTTTASIPAPGKIAAPGKAVPTPPAKPTVLASVEPDAARAEAAQTEKAKDDVGKPAVITGWVVRDVYQGVALVEGRRGSMEVVPGVSIPGAGIVKSIERHGGGWTVTTTKGQLAFAAPQREPRRGYRGDYYGPRRYDF